MHEFILKGILLGSALAMDAFSVSVVNGLNESGMSRKKTVLIPLTFAFFQFIMPLAGWFIVTFMQSLFEDFRAYIPVTALILLLFIGGKMLIESILALGNKGEDEKSEYILDHFSLMIQGFATSIDALSVGLTVSDYSFLEAFLTALIIAAVTFLICLTGIVFGKRIGSRISHGAGILGGIILILIGIRIFVS